MAEQQNIAQYKLDPKNYNFVSPEQTKATEEIGQNAAELKAQQPGYEAEIQRQFMDPELQKQSEANKAYAERIGGINKEMETSWQAPKMEPQDYMMHATMMAMLGTFLGHSGQQSAQGAINGMTGYLKGVHEGNQQLIETSKKEYDANMQRLKSLSDSAKSQYEAIKTELAIDQEKAQMLANQFKANFNGGIAALEARYLSAQNIDKAQNERANMALKIDEFNQKLGAEYLIAQIKASNKGGGMNGRYAFNIAESFAQSSQDLLNITKQPKGTVLGTFSNMTGLGGDTLTQALRNTFTRKITKPEARDFQILVTGFEQNMARALGGGYAQSGSKHIVDAYKQQISREGDSPATQALFLARAKQELVILNKAFRGHPGANEELISQMQAWTDQLNQAIPFNVEDVLKATGKGRETEGAAATNMILPKVPTLEEFMTAGRKANPGVTDQQLIEYYHKRYGEQ